MPASFVTARRVGSSSGGCRGRGGSSCRQSSSGHDNCGFGGSKPRVAGIGRGAEGLEVRVAGGSPGRGV